MTQEKVVSPLFKTFETDPRLEKEGIVIQYGTTTRDGKEVPINITIARAGGANTRYEQVLEHETKPYKRMIQTDSLDPKVGKKIMRTVFSKAVALGWDNMQDENGNFINFTPANFVAQMELLPDLFSDLQSQANNQSLFRKVIVEEDVKN